LLLDGFQFLLMFTHHLLLKPFPFTILCLLLTLSISFSALTISLPLTSLTGLTFIITVSIPFLFTLPILVCIQRKVAMILNIEAGTSRKASNMHIHKAKLLFLIHNS
jgi:hypothetical protein